MTANPSLSPRRKPALLIATAVFVVVGIAVALWLVVAGDRYVETDNAYVDTPPVVVTALVPAPVRQVNVTDTQVVKAGDVLVVLDDADLKLTEARAQAQLAMTRRKVNTYYADDSSLHARAALADANLKDAEAALARAKTQSQDAAGQAAVAMAQTAQKTAEAQMLAARGQMSANGDLIDHVGPDTHPEVTAAAATVAQADLAIARTLIRAPVSGIIARTDVGVGQYAVPGAPLMSIIPVDEAFVNANFKEAQLRRVKPGQPVTLTSDLYGKSVIFHGKVAGISGGTGSTLALIPAQNATGNWIKVVQRLPVRIVLDTAEIKAHPLRLGMTMTARIDTGVDDSDNK